jgi:hypothetical protein
MDTDDALQLFLLSYFTLSNDIVKEARKIVDKLGWQGAVYLSHSIYL